VKHITLSILCVSALEGTTTGAAAGALTGGVIGLLAGIGTLAIPGVEPLIAAGPFMAALSGAAIGGTTGGIVGGLVGLALPKIEPKRYEKKLKSATYLAAMRMRDDDEEDRAERIFEDAGAADVTTTSISPTPDGEEARRCRYRLQSPCRPP
jgi:hypothetical protein